MKKKIFVSIMVGTILVSMLGACGTQGIVNSNVATEQAENQEQENVEVSDTQNEEVTEIVRLETGHFYYDENGEVVESVETEYDIYGNAVYLKVNDRELTLEYEYDNCNIIQCVARYDGEAQLYVREYDEANNFIKESVYYDENLLYEYEYTYDENGNMICKDNGRGVKEEWIYDSNNNVIKYTMGYLPGEELVLVEEYDSSGNLLKKIGYGEWEEYEYNESGNLIKYRYCTDEGFVEYWSDLEYDENENLMRVTSYDADGIKRWVYEYECDEYGNILSEIVYDEMSDGTLWEAQTAFYFRGF